MRKVITLMLLFVASFAAAQHVDQKVIPPHELPHSQKLNNRRASVRVKATAHSTTLNWNASTGTSCAGTLGYWVYSGATSGGENFSTPLNTTALTVLSFVDTNVVALQTKFYVLKAGCSSSTAGLSVPSAEVKATTPADVDPAPNPPTGVSAVAQ